MWNILCIIQAPVPSTDISIIRPFRYLERNHGFKWRLVLEETFTSASLNGIDLVVFHRNCRPYSLSILQHVKNSGLPIIYEVDDNYLELPADTPMGQYMRQPETVHTIESYFKLADIVKVGSPVMIPMVSRWNPNVVCHPFAVDLDIIADIVPEQCPTITIGYAATIHHYPDLEPVIQAIPLIVAQFPDIRWEFIGCFPMGLDGLPNVTHTEFIPDYDTFLRELRRRAWHIGLAPLKDTPSNRSKTDNKLREYGACGIPGIYSDIPPYSMTVEHGRTGLLADNTATSWVDAIRTLVTNPMIRHEIAERARRRVAEKQSLPVIADLWIDLFKKATRQPM